MPNSISDAVGAAALSAVQAIGLTAMLPGTEATKDAPAVPGGIGSVPVLRRKTPSLPQGKRPPAFVVSVGDVVPTEYLTATQKLRTYPVAVTIVTGGGTVLNDDPVVRQWRDQIDAALDNRAAFAGVPGFNQVDAQGGAPFDVAALSKDLNYSIQTFAVQVIEPRTG